ncbi:phage tail tube protein [Sphingomonas sp. Leaf4]|uniref:phage tail tube protein n=1 Tax=Sphingomonas sp. Leaf4 TaxID=2876553 RepID=UPI001E300734|nr:phage tail tube protein [Sphingomonas sp. Leaf4]
MAVIPTKRARGANALLHTGFESTYGQPPASGYRRVPFVSHQLGATRGWIESDLLGQGRAPFDPTQDVTVNDGNLVVPVDTRAIGVWLRALFGAPVTTGPVSGLYTHVFTSGAAALPSLAAEVALPEIPRYSTNYGLRANSVQIAMSRTGLLNATLAMIGKGETSPLTASSAGAPTAYAAIDRFAQAVGYVGAASDTYNGVASAQFTYSNALDKVETIQPDGEIEDVDPGMPSFTGSLTLRGLDTPMEASGRDGTPRPLVFGWARGTSSLRFSAPRVFFPRVKTPIEGPNGIQQSVDFLAAASAGVLVTATLVNDVASY